jgi:hypothetical protein
MHLNAPVLNFFTAWASSLSNLSNKRTTLHIHLAWSDWGHWGSFYWNMGIYSKKDSTYICECELWPSAESKLCFWVNDLKGKLAQVGIQWKRLKTPGLCWKNTINQIILWHAAQRSLHFHPGVIAKYSRLHFWPKLALFEQSHIVMLNYKVWNLCYTDNKLSWAGCHSLIPL